MKNKAIKLLTTVAVIVLSVLALSACKLDVNKTSSGLTYALNEDDITYTLTGCGDAADADIVIPKKHGGKLVTAIADKAFENDKSMTSVFIPDSVTTIGDYAFSGCENLKAIKVDENNGYYKSVDGDLYSKDGTVLVAYAPAKIEEAFSVPNGVTAIGAGAFKDNGALKTLTIPKSVTSIGPEAFDVKDQFLFAYYTGTAKEWAAIAYADGTDMMAEKPVYYYSETKPTDAGNYWHYTDGGVAVWNTLKTGLSFQLNEDRTSYSVKRVTDKTFYNFVIPETYNGLPVTGVLKGAFGFGDAVVTVNFSKNVEYIDAKAFYVAGTVRKVTVDEDNQYFTVVDGVLYDKQLTTALYAPPRLSKKEITVPEGVTTIRESAFYYANFVQKINLPSTLERIEKLAFETARALVGINVPDGVTYIGDGAFHMCLALTEINIPANVTHMGEGCFSFCNGLTAINVDENNPAYKSVNGILYTKDGKTLKQYPAGKTDESFVIPSTVESIEKEAFCYSKIRSITIPDTVKVIGERAFYNNDGITSVTIPDGIVEIPYGAFNNCDNLKSVVFPSSLKVIGDNAFEFCDLLNNVALPDGLEEIGENAFDYCYALSDIYVPDSVKKIGDCAFMGTAIKTFNVSENLTELGSGLFTYSADFEGYTVDGKNPNYVAVDGVLFNKDMTEILCYPEAKTDGHYEIPATVTTIGVMAFCSCGITVTLPAGLKVISCGAFSDFYGMDNMIIPDGVTTIGRDAFSYSWFEFIVIPASVTEIYQDAFTNFTDYITVYYYGTEKEWKNVLVEDTEEYGEWSVYFYSEVTPTAEGKFWHYDESGAPVAR